MKRTGVKLAAKAAKRSAIENEIAQIVEYDKNKMLLANLKSRRREEFFTGDRVKLLELRYKNARDTHLGERMYRVRTGTVVQVTESGYLIEGISLRGVPSRDFVNRAHLINGTVSMQKDI